MSSLGSGRSSLVTLLSISSLSMNMSPARSARLWCASECMPRRLSCNGRASFTTSKRSRRSRQCVRGRLTNPGAVSSLSSCAVVPQPQLQGHEGASTERLRLEAAAAVSVELEAVWLTTERERRSAAEREDTLQVHAQVASLQQHLHAACTAEARQVTLEAGLEGRSRSSRIQAEARAGRGGGWCGGSRERTSARRSEGRGPCEAAQRTGRHSRLTLRGGAGRGLPVGSGNRVTSGP